MNAQSAVTPSGQALQKELVHIDPMDLGELLAQHPEQLLGKIIELNRRPRYNNRLDAIGLFQRLLEFRKPR